MNVANKLPHDYEVFQQEDHRQAHAHSSCFSQPKRSGRVTGEWLTQEGELGIQEFVSLTKLLRAGEMRCE